MVLTSLKTFSEAIKIPVTFIPENFQWDNYVKAWNTLPFATLFYNTIIMMLFRILFAIIFSSMAGYAFAKLNFRVKNIIYFSCYSAYVTSSNIYNTTIFNGC